MKKIFIALPVAALVAVGAVGCSEEGPVGVHDDAELLTDVILTEGVPAPAKPFNPPVALSGFDPPAFATLGGSTTSPVVLTPNTCASGSSAEITITFSVSGNQLGTATFKVKPLWSYDGSTWAGSGETEVTVGPQSGGSVTFHPVDITITNNSTQESGTSTFPIETFDLSNTNATGAKLEGSANATVHVAFTECEGDPDPPVLTLPDPIVLEATSSSGALYPNALDDGAAASDGDGTVPVTCERATGSGTTFPIGETVIDCSATGAGGTTTGSYSIHVQDTTAPVFTTFPSNATPVADDIDGFLLDLADFEFVAEDKGPEEEPGDVSGPVSIGCSILDADDVVLASGTIGVDEIKQQVAIGQIVIVSCLATDAASYRPPGDETPAPNTSVASTFNVTVGLDVADYCGYGAEEVFGAPLRIAAPYSAHQRNSTVPFKVCAPRYANDIIATDLADGLTFVLKHNGSVQFGGEEVDDVPAAGSTSWRYDTKDEHYIFNAKTARTWKDGTWEAQVSYAGIQLAWTYFVLR